MAEMDSIVELLSGVFTILYPLTETQVENRRFDCLKSRGGGASKTAQYNRKVCVDQYEVYVDLNRTFTCICRNCASDQSLSYAIRLARKFLTTVAAVEDTYCKIT